MEAFKPFHVNNATALWIEFVVRLGVPSDLTTLVLRAARPAYLGR